jgi:hypothetical protein
MSDQQITSEIEEPTKTSPRLTIPRQRGDAMFALFAAAVSLFLLSQIGFQTKWIEGENVLVQPRFWPGISLIGMVIFSIGYLIQSLRDVRHGGAGTYDHRVWQPMELLNWLRTLEYAGYFLIYVTAVPVLGYLTATLIFCALLTIRVGYRSSNYIGWSLISGFLIVLVFKTFLQVKLPAGSLYHLLPDTIGNLFIKYF